MTTTTPPETQQETQQETQPETQVDAQVDAQATPKPKPLATATHMAIVQIGQDYNAVLLDTDDPEQALRDCVRLQLDKRYRDNMGAPKGTALNGDMRITWSTEYVPAPPAIKDFLQEHKLRRLEVPAVIISWAHASEMEADRTKLHQSIAGRVVTVEWFQQAIQATQARQQAGATAQTA